MSDSHSSKYKNLCLKHKQSPKELKEKMRKDYRDKVKSCRNMLVDSLRGPEPEKDICHRLGEIYKSMYTGSGVLNNDELQMLEELKAELLQEQIEWWATEYEKFKMENVDWASFEEVDNVICPVCQKHNYEKGMAHVSCTHCQYTVVTAKPLGLIKRDITEALQLFQHSGPPGVCGEPQFAVINEGNESHVYLICGNCTDMTIVF